MKKKSVLAWIWDFVSLHKIYFVLSLIFAFASVISGFLPYFFIGGMINQLLAGNKNWDFYLQQSAWAGLAWIGYWGFHGISTMLSHTATFKILAEMRRRLTEKLARLPLGTVLSQSSGSYKNIIVERVDATETTLAHLIPEFTAGIFGPIIVLIAMLVIDWRLTLLSLLTIPIVVLAYVRMAVNSEADYQNTLVKTKKLNDTAVEYINGIEVIKVFGKEKFSYDKFVTAAREGADCFIEWMRKFNLEMGIVTAFLPSGSGKSTIAKLLASFWDVSSGQITYGGLDIRQLPLDYYSRQIAYVTQDNYLFDETIMENIRMGNPAASDEEVIEIARRCGCYDFIMNLEDGFETQVGSGGGHLSGGERQRIAIARAMLKDAPILILDEATAYTDPENEARIQASLARLIEGRTLIVIAHRLSTIMSADQIVLVNDGRIEARGRHEELLTASPLYASMWRAHIATRDNSEMEGGLTHA